MDIFTPATVEDITTRRIERLESQLYRHKKAFADFQEEMTNVKKHFEELPAMELMTDAEKRGSYMMLEYFLQRLEQLAALYEFRK